MSYSEEQKTMLTEDFTTLLKHLSAKYPNNKNLEPLDYMSNLGKMQFGLNPDNLLYIEVEILIQYHQNLLIQKIIEENPEDEDNSYMLKNNKDRLWDWISKWSKAKLALDSKI